MIRDDSLPEGWSSAVDPAYNHVYYFNVSTGQRTWEKPAAAPKAAPAQPPAQVKPLSWRCLCSGAMTLNCKRGGSPGGAAGAGIDRQ